METLNDRPPTRPAEPVQFWLAIAMVSLAVHSVFLFGVQRLAKVAAVEPSGGAIEVEFVPGAVGQKDDQQEAIVAGAQAGEKKAAVKLETQVPPPVPQAEPETDAIDTPKPDANPEPKPEPKPSSKPSPKASRSPQPKPSSKPAPPKPQPKPSEPTPKKSGSPSKNGEPVDSKDPLTQPNAGGGMRSVGLQVTAPTYVEQDAAVKKAKLELTGFPNALSVSNRLPLNPGQPLDIEVGLEMNCKSSIGQKCDPSRATLKVHSASVRNNDLHSSEEQELLLVVEEIFKTVRASVLDVIVDTQEQPSTFWSVTVRMIAQ